MSLAPGHTLAHYEILAPLGKGGMGEVYRAKDAKLGREVAIKVLPEAFSRDDERLARFRREAKVLASLNHPNIAAIYGLEHSGETHYLVLELVEGETLQERIARGALSKAEALDFALQIAEALEEAHEHGVVHRDLKPANVKLTPDGKVKVLDFGLAKAFAEDAPEADSSLSPTITRDATRAGVILGTAAYMSPEQAKGRRVDKRADVFAFGSVLYEMLSGKKAFAGDDVSEVLASVLKLEPDWKALPRELDPRLASLLRRCLDKDPKKRWRDIGDVRHAILDALDTPRPASTGKSPRWHVGVALGFVAGALLAGFLAPLVSREARPPPRRVVRAALPMPPGQRLGSGLHILDVSRDGARVVYVANDGLLLRELDSKEAIPVRGSSGGRPRDPTFSPDGDWVVFHAFGKLKKISVRGGRTVTLCRATDGQGASWVGADFLLFPQPKGIFRVSSNGGVPELLIELDTEAGERAQGPRLLPDGRTVLFTLGRGGNNWDRAAIVAQDLSTGVRHVLIEGGTDTVYAPSGHLLYANGNTLFAVPFDLDRLEVTGGPVPVVEGIARNFNRGTARYHVSDNGVLVYVSGSGNETTLSWADRTGALEPIAAPGRAYRIPRLSPDGDRLAVLFDGDLWVVDLRRSAWTRLTFTGDNDQLAFAWTSNGTRIVFSSTRDGPANLYQVSADGSGPAEALLEPGAERHLDAISGERLVFHVHTTEDETDLWWLSLEDDRDPQPYLQTPFNERIGALSPDGRWLAYVSDETGTEEVYVRSFPDPSSKYPISTGSAGAPRWSRDGRELFFVTQGEDRTLMKVQVSAKPGFRASTPTPLFSESAAGVDLSGGGYIAFFDVSPESDRFLVLQTHGETTPRINLVLNWFEELERLVPG